MVIKFRILQDGLNQVIEKLTYPRIKVEINPDDPSLKMKNIEIIDKKCSINELANSLGEIICYMIKHFKYK